MQIFSERLKYERKHQGYSQTEMAQLLGISYGTYKNYELLGTPNGRKPPFEVVCQIAKILNVRVDYLFGLED